jgi:N-acetylglucosaminyl-diphospho-decaprenol L-rhamnosyltransferase
MCSATPSERNGAHRARPAAPPRRTHLGRAVSEAQSQSLSPLVSLIAINHNGLDQVERFMAGVRASSYRPLELIVVDNASTDGSAERYEQCAEATVVRSAENLGYGRGCNLGAEHARGPLLLFMNPDVSLHADTIAVLVADLERTPGAAVVCATMLEAGFAHERSEKVEDVAAMAATTMLVERSHFEALGGFDPWIFLYSEDTDLCYRTWLLGWRVLKSWDAVAEHDVGGTGGGHGWSADQIKNGLYVHLKLRGWPATARYAARMAAKTLIRGVRLRDPRVLGAWTANVRELPLTLSKRRALLGAASAEDRARLERLGAEHAYWARRSWRSSALRRLKGCLPGGASAA